MSDPVPPPPYRPPQADPGHAGGSSFSHLGPAAAGGPPRRPGVVADPATFAASGLIAAVLFTVAAGLIAAVANERFHTRKLLDRLVSLTNTVDVGNVALLGGAVALLLLTPHPSGGFGRPLLLLVTAALSGVITIYAGIRALILISGSAQNRFYPAFYEPGFLGRLSQTVATVGVGIAAATVGFYAARESFLKRAGRA